MPTARELLEQADALMRRNRLDVHDDIPVLTDAVPARADAPRAATSGAYVDFGAGEADGPASVPTLTDSVDAHLPDAVSVAMEGEPSDWLDFDDVEPSVIGDAPDSIAIVPPVDRLPEPDAALLDSAEHEEIELTLPVDDELERERDARPGTLPWARDDHGGEASPTETRAAYFMLDDVVRSPGSDVEGDIMEPPEAEDGGERATPGIGEATTGNGVSDGFLRAEPLTPPVETKASSHTAQLDVPQETLPSTMNYEVTVLDVDVPATSPAAKVWSTSSAEAAATDAESSSTLATDVHPPSIGQQFASAASPQAVPDLQAMAAEAPIRAPKADIAGEARGMSFGAGSLELLEARPHLPDAATPSAASLTAAWTAAIPAVAVPTTPAQIALDAAGEKAQWDAIAEEIRMQVLQRIDLFTDTGLREQLGAHLKPIVDRASADLVATINLRVGDLLRAYVAEAIEREIELWRRDN